MPPEPQRRSAALWYAPTCAPESEGDDLRLVDRALVVRRLTVVFPPGPEYALRLRPYAVGPDGSTRDLVQYPADRPYLIGDNVVIRADVDVEVPADWRLGVYWRNLATFEYQPTVLMEADYLGSGD